MPKQSKQIIIDAIVKEIEKGNRRGNVLGKIAKKWEISRTTFDRHWKTANQQQQERQRKASEAADKAYIAAKENAAKEAVMSKHERLEFLTKIIKAKTDIKTIGKAPLCILIHEDGTKEIITLKDKLAAIAELNKMEGDYAPLKVAQTDTEGKDILLENLSQNELQVLLMLKMKLSG